jgi:hypothetical protein
MTAVTQTVRDQAFLALECDIPQGKTIAQYRAERASRPARRRRRVARPRRS